MNLYQPTITGSLSVSGSINISGSINVVGGGGTITGTASYATNADLLDGLDSTVFTLTSSFAAQTASFTAFTASQNILNGTYATTGSNTFTSPQTINSNLIVTGSITAQTLVVQTITSSVDFVTGSTRFGSLAANTHVFSGSVTMNPGGLFVSSSGLVGIGNVVPAYTLDVSGTLRTTSDVVLGGGSTIFGTTGSKFYIYPAFSTNLNLLQNYNGSAYTTEEHRASDYSYKIGTTAAMTITSAGDVYMGAATGASNVIIGSNGTPSANGTGNLQFINSNSYFSWQISAGGTPAGALTFSQSTTNGGSTFSTERMRIISSGQVGINMTPGSDRQFMVKGIDATSNNFVVTFQNNAAYLFEIRNDGVIFTGTLSGSPYNNSVTGRDAYLSSSGVLGYLSSTRESKTNINSVSDINWVSQLKPVSFNYRKKDDVMNYTEEFFDDKSFGFIADEVEKVNPDFVFYDINEDGTKKLAGVKYQSMTAILVKAIQEQQIQIQNLQEQINILAK